MLAVAVGAVAWLALAWSTVRTSTMTCVDGLCRISTERAGTARIAADDIDEVEARPTPKSQTYSVVMTTRGLDGGLAASTRFGVDLARRDAERAATQITEYLDRADRSGIVRFEVESSVAPIRWVPAVVVIVVVLVLALGPVVRVSRPRPT